MRRCIFVDNIVLYRYMYGTKLKQCESVILVNDRCVALLRSLFCNSPSVSNKSNIVRSHSKPYWIFSFSRTLRSAIHPQGEHQHRMETLKTHSKKSSRWRPAVDINFFFLNSFQRMWTRFTIHDVIDSMRVIQDY